MSNRSFIREIQDSKHDTCATIKFDASIGTFSIKDPDGGEFNLQLFEEDHPYDCKCFIQDFQLVLKELSQELLQKEKSK